MWRSLYNKHTAEGVSLDKSPPPIYLPQVQDVVRALLRHGTDDSIKRAFAILTAWLCAGRSAELGWVTLEGCERDPFFSCIFLEMPQLKTSKNKVRYPCLS